MSVKTQESLEKDDDQEESNTKELEDHFSDVSEKVRSVGTEGGLIAGVGVLTFILGKLGVIDRSEVKVDISGLIFADEDSDWDFAGSLKKAGRKANLELRKDEDSGLVDVDFDIEGGKDD